MNSITASFNTTMLKMTEMSQKKSRSQLRCACSASAAVADRKFAFFSILLWEKPMRCKGQKNSRRFFRVSAAGPVSSLCWLPNLSRTAINSWARQTGA